MVEPERKNIDGEKHYKCVECSEWFKPEYDIKTMVPSDEDEIYKKQHDLGVCSEKCLFKYEHLVIASEYDDLEEEAYMKVYDYEEDEVDVEVEKYRIVDVDEEGLSLDMLNGYTTIKGDKRFSKEEVEDFIDEDRIAVIY